MTKRTLGCQQFFWWAAIVISILCQRCEATLVISIYNNNAVYLASDSLLSPCDDRLKKINGPKIFMVSTNFCVAMSGLFGIPEKPRTNQPSGLFVLSGELKSFCDEEYSQPKPLKNKVMSIGDHFDEADQAYLEKMKSEGISLLPEDQGTRLYFVGYDSSRTNFVGLTSVYGIDIPDKVVFIRGVNHFGPPITEMGESKFINAVVSSNDPRFKDVRSKIPKTFNEALYELPISEEDMTNLILQLFQLHKKYAASFYSDEGNIGEPYVIYKITKEGVKRVH